MDRMNMDLDIQETALIALAIYMQIKTLHEAIESMKNDLSCDKGVLIEMRNMLASYRSIYKRFYQYKEIVEDYMNKVNLEN